MAPAFSILIALGALITSASCSLKPRVVSFPISQPATRRLVKRGTITSEISNTIPIGGYLINVTIGTPPQPVSLVLDTGSSDIWMFGPQSCDQQTSECVGGTFDPSSSSSLTKLNAIPFKIQYETPGSGVHGTYFQDYLHIGSTSISSMTMAYATSAKYTNTGVFGISFTDDESAASQGKTYPNVIDVMVSQNLIGARAYSLYLDNLDDSTGTILFGGFDSDKFQGELKALAIQKDQQSHMYNSMTVAWTSLAITDATGSTGLLTPSGFTSPAVLDSGTTVTLVPQDIFNTLASYFQAEDAGDGNVFVNCDLAQQKGTVDFGFGGADGPIVPVPFSELAVPQYNQDGSRATYRDGTPVCYFGFAAPQSGQQILFGDTFLRSAYVVYDLDKLEIAIAPTKFDVSSSNIQEIGSNGIGAATTVLGVVVTPTPYHPVAVTPAGTPGPVTEAAPFTSKALPGVPTTEAALTQISIAASTSTGNPNSAHTMKADSFLVIGSTLVVMLLAGMGLVLRV